MMDVDDPLDFEFEDPLVNAPVINQERKKVIGLDDLLTGYYEESKVIERESKRAKSLKNYNSDEDDCGKEALLSRKIHDCHNQMGNMSTEEGISTWDLQVFGYQVELPIRVERLPRYSDLKKALETYGFLFELSLQTTTANTVAAKVGSNGVLIVRWTSNFENKDIFPKLSCYYIHYVYMLDANHRGPPENIRGWIKFAAAYYLVRSKQPLFSVSEVEELIKVIINLSLDCQLQGLQVLLYGCMQSAISYFTDEEWSTSCEKIARTLACG